MRKVANLFLIVGLLAVGCGGENASFHTESPANVTYPPYSRVKEIEMPRKPGEVKAAAVYAASVTTSVPTSEPDSPGVNHQKTWDAYIRAKSTPLSYWDLCVAATLADVGGAFLDNVRSLFDPFDSAEREGTWTHWGYFKSSKSKESFGQRTLREYDERMDSEYYFVRVPKFRAPISATEGAYYTWYVAVAPDLKTKADWSHVAKQAGVMRMGDLEFLQPGQKGSGSTSIIAIARKHVQALFGYWNEEVVIQYGVLQVDPKLATGGKELESVKREMLMTHTFSFNALKENQIFSRDAIWTFDGENSTAISLQLWKGDWKANRN